MNKKTPDKKEKLLLVKLTSMGDIIHTLPALTDLMRAKPDISIDWAIDPNFAEIANWHNFINKKTNKIINTPIRQWKKDGWIKSIRAGKIKNLKTELTKTKYDLIIDAQGLIKSALVAKFAKPSKSANTPIIGYDRKSIRDSSACFFYNQKYNISKRLHAVERIRQLFATHFKYDLNSYELDYGINKNLKSNKYSWPKAINKPKKPYIVCLHGTTWNSKLWPTQHWVEFVIESIKRGYAIKITSGNDIEFKRAQDIKSGAITVIPDADIQVLPRLNITDVALMLNSAAAATAVDTGFAHLAAALNTPQISIYGSTNSKLTAAYGHHQKSLQSTIECSPCMKRECAHPRFKELKYPPCYEKLNAKRIWNELECIIREAKNS